MFNVGIEYNSSCFYVSKDLIHIFLCYKAKVHHVFAFDTPSSTQYGTRSDIASRTTSCTKMVGNMAVMVLAASGERIGNMGFSHAYPL
jgi:hypothetical protein